MSIIRCLINKFKYAFEGLIDGIRNDRSIQIQCGFGLLAVLLGLILNLSLYDWALIVFAIGLVIVAEFMNSSIEVLSDFICAEHDDNIKKVKDLAAGGVLVAAFIALIIGIIVYSKYIF